MGKEIRLDILRKYFGNNVVDVWYYYGEVQLLFGEYDKRLVMMADYLGKSNIFPRKTVTRYKLHRGFIEVYTNPFILATNVEWNVGHAWGEEVEVPKSCVIVKKKYWFDINGENGGSNVFYLCWVKDIPKIKVYTFNENFYKNEKTIHRQYKIVYKP